MADHEDRESHGRSTSPYHKRCFPPYCENAPPVIDKHAIGKMNRDDLEDRYIVYGDENLSMKKQLRENEKQIQRLQTALARQDQLDKKGGRKPASSQYENDRIDALESLNKSLQARVKVLKQQLMTHSYYHAKEHKLAEGREKRKREMNSSPDFSFRDSQTHSARESRARSYKNDTPRRSNIDSRDVADLKEKVALMEQLLETQREKYKSKISLLEKQLAAAEKPNIPSSENVSVHSQKLSDNVEMIKLRRQNQEQARKIASLTEQQETALREIAELQGYVKDANNLKDKVQTQLDSEREKLQSVQSQLSKSLSNSETIKVLEEQVRDLQNEKMTLKDTNSQLLKLTTGSLGKSSSERISQENKLKHQISSLEKMLKDKIQDLEVKNEKIIKLESLADEAKPQDITTRTCSTSTEDFENKEETLVEERVELENKLSEALEEIKSLKKELSDLHFVLNEPKSDEEQLVKSIPSDEKTHLSSKSLVASGEHLSEDPEENDPNIVPLTPSLLKVQELLTTRRNPAKPEQEPLRFSSTDFTEVNYSHRLTLKDGVTDITNPPSINNPTPPRSTPSTVQSCRSALRQPRMVSYEVRSMSYSEFGPELDGVNDAISNPEKKQLIEYQPKKDTFSMLVDEEDQVPQTFSAKTIEPKPLLVPKVIIVSDHEFDKGLMQKQEYLAKTEVLLPVDRKDDWNCRLEICIYDLEINRELLDQLNKIESNPYVSVVWSFLGLEQRTAAMPANNAQFHTNSSYFGPMSRNMTEFVQKEVIPVWLVLVGGDRKSTKVAEGGLDVTPALEQSSRTFLRSIALRSKHPGSATVHVSFKLHDCCKTDLPAEAEVEVPETIEVGIGRLSLKSPPPKLDATHFYVEYSLLGKCGSELETDSVPKAEVMSFNHRKKHKVTEENSPTLGPLLNPQATKALRFNVLAEPCDLDQTTEVKEIGFAEVNLLNEMVYKDEDMISAPFPVFNELGETLGSLSLTVIGCSTLQNHADLRHR